MASVDTWIEHWARHRPDHVAIREGDRERTYRAFHDEIVGAAAVLASRGVTVGDRVAFCGSNRIEQLTLLFACARLGAILVPLNNRLSTAEHRFQIDHCDPSLLVATDGFADRLVDAAGGRPVLDLDRDPDALAADRAAGPGSPDAAGLDLLIVYTSGTTGRPKGAVHTQRSLLFTVLNGVAHQELVADDVVLTFLPIFHVGGLNIQTVPALYVGATVELLARFDPGEVLRLLAARRPTHTLAVPATMVALLDHPDVDLVDWSCLRGLNSGSSVVPPTLIRAFHERGVPVGQVYGATETGPTAVVLGFDDAFDHVGSCGQAALHTDVRVVDGELWVRGPNVFDRYWNDPDATAEAFVDGWYRTGDLGRIDDAGFVTVEDRRKDLLISGGENVYPAEVELALADHPGIAEVAVIGRPDDRWGEVAVACVVPTTAAEGTELTVEGVRAWCEGRLARFKQPREIVLFDALPRTALGKVTKHVLRDRLLGEPEHGSG